MHLARARLFFALLAAPLMADDRAPAWRPDGGVVAFESNRDGNWEIYTAAPDGSGAARLTEFAGDDRWPAWSPDGKSLVFARARAGGRLALHLLDPVTKKTAVLACEWPRGEGPPPAPGLRGEWGKGEIIQGEVLQSAWSPDGKTVLFAWREGPRQGLATVPVKGGKIRILTDGDEADAWPRWSPNGRRFVCHSRGSYDTHLGFEKGRGFEDKLSKEEITRRRAFEAEFERRRRNDEPRFVLHTRDFVADDEITLGDEVTKQFNRVTVRSGADTCATFAPSGRALAYAETGADGRSRVRLISVGGEVLFTAGEKEYEALEPAWSPDGRCVAYAAREAAGAPLKIVVETLPEYVRQVPVPKI